MKRDGREGAGSMGDTVGRGKDEIVKSHGPWTAHNVRLGARGPFTIGEKLNYDTVKLRRVVQALSDLAGGEFGSMRVLDLGVLEGLYTIELGLQNVKEAVGVEAREANIRKAEFSKKALGMENIKFRKDDVRAVTEEKYGRFDVILCLGILYHLDTPAVFELLERLSGMCNRYLVIDSHIALESDERVEYRGAGYFGKRGREFKKGLSSDQKIRAVWSAVDNEENFLLSKKSILALLGRWGFTSVFECLLPLEYVKPADRVTLIAVKGKKACLKTFPSLDALDEKDVRKAMLESGATELERENAFMAAARGAFRAVKSLSRRALGRNQDLD